MASSPVARVHYLITGERTRPGAFRNEPTNTPTTLQMHADGLYSYRMRIAFKDGDDWVVTMERSTVTTNRHISAVSAALVGLGYVPVTYKEQVPGSDANPENAQGRTTTQRAARYSRPKRGPKFDGNTRQYVPGNR